MWTLGSFEGSTPIQPRLLLNALFLLPLLLLLTGAHCNLAGTSAGDRPTNSRLPFWWVKLRPESRRAYNHSILKSFRGKSDCTPRCPSVDVWQYQYKPKKHIKTLTSKRPISTLKKYWKTSFEARLISVSVFGSNPKYVEGLENLIKSNASLKKYNNIKANEAWAYDTFTIRAYVPKRSPKSKNNKPIKGELPKEFIEKLLNLGVEIAFVDNGLDKAGLDATFWRFLVTAEHMPSEQKIRYLVRDSDTIITAAEAFGLGKWISSDYQFLRLQLIPTCMSPLAPLAFAFNGSHSGKSPFYDLKTFIEHYPYRMQYGDDEMFARDIMWPVILDRGSILTYYIKYPVMSTFSEPYKGSCGRPTQPLCDVFGEGAKCPDFQIPNWIDYDFIKIGSADDTTKLLEIPSIFEMNLATHPAKREVEIGLSDQLELKRTNSKLKGQR